MENEVTQRMERRVHRGAGAADQSGDHGRLRRGFAAAWAADQPGQYPHGPGAVGEKSAPALVSRVLRIEKSTLSRDLELMKQKGWLASDPPSGGRSQKIRLTTQGTRLLAKIQPAWERAQAEARALIGPEGELALQQIAARLGFGQAGS